jgi:hypothetical protein
MTGQLLQVCFTYTKRRSQFGAAEDSVPGSRTYVVPTFFDSCVRRTRALWFRVWTTLGAAVAAKSQCTRGGDAGHVIVIAQILCTGRTTKASAREQSGRFVQKAELRLRFVQETVSKLTRCLDQSAARSVPCLSPTQTHLYGPPPTIFSISVF